MSNFGRRKKREQAYLVLCSEETQDILITKKAFTNPLFRNKRNTYGIINQAGQYALPGGKIEYNQNAETAAFAEFHEELGIDISRAPGLSKVLKSYPEGFSVLLCSVPEDEFQKIFKAAEHNISAKTISTEDMEHKSIHRATSQNITNFLGKRQKIVEGQVPKKIVEAIEKSAASGFTQNIEWYAQIAQDVQVRLAEEKAKKDIAALHEAAGADAPHKPLKATAYPRKRPSKKQREKASQKLTPSFLRSLSPPTTPSVKKRRGMDGHINK